MIGRRKLLSMDVGAACGLGLSSAARALAPPAPLVVGEARKLKFQHLRTGEALQVTYFEQGRYDPAALEQVKHLLRDFRDGSTHEIDPACSTCSRPPPAAPSSTAPSK